MNHIFRTQFLFLILLLMTACHQQQDDQVEERKQDSKFQTMLLELAKSYYSVQDLQRAIILYDSVIKLANASGNFDPVAEAYTGLGNVKIDLHDFTGAKRMFDSSYQVALRHRLYKHLGVAAGSLARFDTSIRQATNTMQNAINLLKKEPGTREAIARLLSSIGYRAENPDTAIKYCQAAIRMVNPDSCGEVVIGALNNMAYSLMDKKEFEQAENLLVTQAFPISEKLRDLDWIATLNDTYSDVLMARGKFREAAIAQKKAYQTRGNAYDLQVTSQIRLLAELLDVKNKEIRLNQVQTQLRIKSDHNRLLLFTVMVILTIALFIILWLVQKNRLKSEKQRLSAAMTVIGLEESLKGRLAMELHDMTSPIYTSLLYQIEDVDIPDPAIRDDLHEKLTTLAGRIRKISHELGGKNLELLTFIEIITGFCEEMQYRTGAQIKLQLPEQAINLAGEKKAHIVRIVQEILTNGVKNVKQGEITLEIAQDDDDLLILYYDNGAGFDFKLEEKNGLGLTNIFERAKLLHGKALLDAAPGRGTRWTVRIPVDKDRKTR